MASFTASKAFSFSAKVRVITPAAWRRGGYANSAISPSNAGTPVHASQRPRVGWHLRRHCLGCHRREVDLQFARRVRSNLLPLAAVAGIGAGIVLLLLGSRGPAG